jgi:Na+-translocating ferredoxin:NAD+ oxidoreductase RnfA subunit
MSEQPSPKEWDTEAIAKVGVVCGLIVGSTYELSEALLSPPSAIESFGQIAAEILAATVGGGLVFALISAIRNRLKQDP